VRREKGELAYLEGHPQRHSAASSKHLSYQLRASVFKYECDVTDVNMNEVNVNVNMNTDTR